MVQIDAPWDYESTSDQEETTETKSLGIVELPREWSGDLKIDLTRGKDGDTISLLAVVDSDGANITIGADFSPDEADELADALRSGASSIREHSE